MSLQNDSTVDRFSNRGRLVAVLQQGQRPLACRTFDLAGDDLTWLAKELAYRTVASVPDAAGKAWRLSLSVEPSDGGALLRLESWTEEPNPTPLTRMDVPADSLAWLADAMLPDGGLSTDDLSDCRLLLAAGHDESLAEAGTELGGADLRLTEVKRRPMLLPKAVPLISGARPTRLLREVPDCWVRCRLTERFWRHFTAAAGAEHSVERAYGAPMTARLADGVWHLVVDLPLVEATDRSDAVSLVTTGRRLRALHARFAGRFAYLHLHPRLWNGEPMTSQASPADFAVAASLDPITPLPVCMPIALWGEADKTLPGEVSAHSFVDGRLQEIPLEIVPG